MPTITYVQRDGSPIEIDVAAGESLMHGATYNNLRGITAECGGSAACATCHVYLEGGPVEAVPAMDMIEDELLDGVAAERTATSRLSCQIIVDDALEGLIVRIPERQV